MLQFNLLIHELYVLGFSTAYLIAFVVAKISFSKQNRDINEPL